MVTTCDQRHPIGIRDRWALLVGRGNLHRRIELADLLISQIEVDDDFVTHWVAMSKTDQDAQGEHSISRPSRTTPSCARSTRPAPG